MVKAGLILLGRVLAWTPEFVLRPVVWLLGRLAWWLIASRRRLILSNLHHAFPERSAAWHAAIGRECFRRVVETACFSMAMPFLPEARIRRMLTGDAGLAKLFSEHQARPHPVMVCTPHVAHWEAGTALRLVVDTPFPEFGVIFRPLDNAAADAWLKRTRERFGMKLLSRREGFLEANHILSRNGCVVILFDQNAGTQGALTTLFGRVCSTTAMPGSLAARNGAEVVSIYPRHVGFWRIQLCCEPIRNDGTAEGITIALNQWLENLLTTDEGMRASWLWGHQRWKNQDAPAARLRLAQKQNFLVTDQRLRGLAALPRRTRLWIRLPNWLGDVVMVLPLLRAVRTARPDAEITLLARPQFLPLLEALGVVDRLRALPAKGGPGYYAHFRALRSEYPDCTLLFTNSFRGDLEAWLTGSPQRFGILRRGHRRPLLSRAYVPPADFDESRRHQFELWTDFLKNFGLQTAPDRSPLTLAGAGTPLTADAPIGLICGSENNPEKRWPAKHWRRLIELLPDTRFLLLGTATDRLITEKIAAGFGDRVDNQAGKTDLPSFARILTTCRLLVTNDTGGMHLANALGVPLIGLFGPTNPVRTGPVFAAPAGILQPPGCPPTGGGSLTELKPETVAAAVRQQLQAKNS